MTMMSISDMLVGLQNVFEKGSINAQKGLLADLGTNLVWNGEEVFVYNKKPIQTLIDGVKSIRADFEKSEPKIILNLQDLNEKTDHFQPVFSTMLGLQDDFRTMDWISVFPYPNVAMKQVESLLAFA
jgi:hypothetical protein